MDVQTIYKLLSPWYFKIYPICNLEYDGYYAISRIENKTEVYSVYDTKEALEKFIKKLKATD